MQHLQGAPLSPALGGEEAVDLSIYLEVSTLPGSLSTL